MPEEMKIRYVYSGRPRCLVTALTCNSAVSPSSGRGLVFLELFEEDTPLIVEEAYPGGDGAEKTLEFGSPIAVIRREVLRANLDLDTARALRDILDRHIAKAQEMEAEFNA